MNVGCPGLKTFKSTEIVETLFAGTLETKSKLIGPISALITGGRYCGSSLGDLTEAFGLQPGLISVNFLLTPFSFARIIDF